MIKNDLFQNPCLVLSCRCSVVLITSRYFEIKTYRNPVYITMIKNVQFEDLYLLLSPGVVSC